MALSPMMKQYLEIKEQYKNDILFFRLGDFYEMFYDDAKLVSKELELVLTGKDCGEEERAPMCGIPFHAANTYIEKLVSRGYKVVICEQVEDPATAKGLVKRDVIRVITPGTVIESQFLDESKNNYLCAIYVDEDNLKKYSEANVSIAFADASTGEIFVTSVKSDNSFHNTLTELGTYQPKEIISNLSDTQLPIVYSFVKERLNGVFNASYDSFFDYEEGKELITKTCPQAGYSDLDDNGGSTKAVGALIKYISVTQKVEKPEIRSIKYYQENQYLQMDINTRRNLELCESMRTKEKKGSLLWVLDKTKTSMGARLLRKWVEQPLINEKAIIRRQNAIGEFYDSFMLREELCEELKHVLDIERLLTKVAYGTANARDLKAIQNTLSVLPKVKYLLRECESDEISKIYKDIDTLEDITSLLDSAISENAPLVLREGGMIKEGYNAEIDRLRDIVQNGKTYIRDIEESEKEKTGIKTLKIGYNRVFGYYIEVSKSFVNMVPETYIRKQTLTTGERYITEELKTLESTILGASDKINAIEYEIFCAIRNKVSEESVRIRKSADALAQIDAYLSLAEVAVKNKYVKPDIEYGDYIQIKNGRHPVVEKYLTGGSFVPNDANLDTNHNRLMLITGPNMAGKSTYMRQVAIIVLMAQMGSYVPAESASICVVDKLFTRVGASDDLASGQSTFMLEMNEVAYILKNATKNSLIIFDEIGRGTSTFDGMSIAKSTAEYTLSKKIGAKTLFATHYHELTEMEKENDGVVNYNIAAKKNGDDITFLRKIVRGSADDSYGIEVAKLAGIPDEIVKRAKAILKKIEKQNATLLVQPVVEEEDDNITFEDISESQIIEKLTKVDPNLLTPIEALNVLCELKKMLNK